MNGPRGLCEHRNRRWGDWSIDGKVHAADLLECQETARDYGVDDFACGVRTAGCQFWSVGAGIMAIADNCIIQLVRIAYKTKSLRPLAFK